MFFVVVSMQQRKTRLIQGDLFAVNKITWWYGSSGLFQGFSFLMPGLLLKLLHDFKHHKAVINIKYAENSNVLSLYSVYFMI